MTAKISFVSLSEVRIFSLKNLFFLCFACLSLSAQAASLDWSGWFRVDGFGLRSSSKNSYYSSYQLVLLPKFHITDGLSLKARLELFPLFLNEACYSHPSKARRQTGPLLFYKWRNKTLNSCLSAKEGAFSKIPLSKLPWFFPSQIYWDYEKEFFKLRLGKAPWHFGMGTTYYASKDPFSYWISAPWQLAFRLSHSPFYVQPALLLEKDILELVTEDQTGDQTGENLFSALIQGGLSLKDWSVEAFLQYKFKESQLFAELFGKYQWKEGDIQASASYGFDDTMKGVLDAGWHPQVSFPLRLELKVGAALNNSFFHPGYDIAFLFWNRFMQKKDTSPSSEDQQNLQLEDGMIQKGIFFSPSLVFSFLDEELKIKTTGLLAHELQDKTWNYELGLEGIYQIEEALSFSLKGGGLYRQKKIHLGLLAQAAVSF